MLGLRHRRRHDLRRTFISLARSDGARTDILRRVTHKPPPEVIEGCTTFEWEVVCREVMKLKLRRRGAAEVVALSAAHAAGDSRSASEGAQDKFATRLATRSSQLPVFAMKSSMALPGLEPDYSDSDEGRLAEVANVAAQVPDSYGTPTTAPSTFEAGLPTINCSNVANALQDLLELAKQAGIDPAHPTMKAAAAELEKLAACIERPPSSER